MSGFEDKLSANTQQKNNVERSEQREEHEQRTNLLDLVNDVRKDSSHNNSGKLTRSELIGSFDNPIALSTYLEHRDARQNRDTYFRAGAAAITRFGRTVLGMSDASSAFESARASGNEGLMITLYKADKEQREFEEKVGIYGSAALKTGFLFTSGKAGWVGLTAISASDSARPSDSFGQQLADTTLGAARGLATRALFMKINEQNWNPVMKGWTYGLGDRFIDNSLNSRYYLNGDGKVDLASFRDGALTALHHTIGAQALATDAATLSVSALLIPIDKYMGGAYFKNVLAQKLTMAGVSGLSEGSLKELNRQQDRMKGIDWQKVAQKGGERAILDTLSAVPGSHLWY